VTISVEETVDVLVGVIGEQRGGNHADDSTTENVGSNGIARMERSEQRGGNERRRPASDNGSELIAEPRTAITQARRERLSNQRCLRTVQVHDDRER